jgi:ABC-type uncharacterized transport system YnjBCD ATPase subunit
MYPNEGGFKRDIEEWRAYVGRYGITGRMQTAKISTLSDGQKSRIVFAILCMKNHNMLLLDEPTNHLVRQLVWGACVREQAVGVLCVCPPFLGEGAQCQHHPFPFISLTQKQQ